jgi:hypothetical protein
MEGTMNRRSFLAGLFGVAASGTLACWSKSSDAVPAQTGVAAPSAIPANGSLAAPDGTPVQQAAWVHRRARRVYRRTYRRAYRRDYYGGYYGGYGGYNRYNGYGGYGGYGPRRICGTYIDRYGYRRSGCRYVDDYY